MLCRKADVRQRFAARSRISQTHMVEYNRRRIFVRLNFLFQISQLHTVLHFQHALHTVAAGDRFCHRDNQIRQLDKLYQNLGHVIDKRYDLSLGQDAGIYTDRAGIQQRNDRNVDDHISNGVHQTGDSANVFLQPGQRFIFFLITA